MGPQSDRAERPVVVNARTAHPKALLAEEIRAHPMRSLMLVFTIGLLAGRFIR